MVTAAQLQIVQSPITSLISSISSSVNVKLDDSNYLNWNFQVQLLLESNGIFGFADGSHPCPASPADIGTTSSLSSSAIVESDELCIWKMHDRAVMQLITATLSPVALSCAIGSTSSRDLWQRLKEQFSTVSRTSIFQLKTNLQNIRKGTDSISQYLLRIKEARDYLAAAGVSFADEDIVILALNGLPAEYNTFRCVIRGRESVITLKEFRSQLLAEELIVEHNTSVHSSFLTAMHATTKPLHSAPHFSRGPNGFNSVDNGGYRSFTRNRGRIRPTSTQRSYQQRSVFHSKPSEFSHVNSGLPRNEVSHVNSSRNFSPVSPVSSGVIMCQLCNIEGHTAPSCGIRGYERVKCSICGKPNHTNWYCYYNEAGPNFIGPSSGSFIPQPQHHALHTMHQASPQSHSQTSAAPSPVWITDTGATNHMTADLSNLSLSSPYPADDTVHTANGEGQANRKDTVQGAVP